MHPNENVQSVQEKTSEDNSNDTGLTREKQSDSDKIKTVPNKKTVKKRRICKENTKIANIRKWKKVHRCLLCQKSSLHVFRFPKNQKIRSQWAEVCKIEVSGIREAYRLCSSHFKFDDFIKTEGNRVRLKKSAVPCVNSKGDETENPFVLKRSKFYKENSQNNSAQATNNVLLLNTAGESSDSLKLNQKCLLLVKKDIPPLRWNLAVNSTNLTTLTQITNMTNGETATTSNKENGKTEAPKEVVSTTLPPLHWNLGLKTGNTQDMILANNTLLNMAKYKPIQPANPVQQAKASEKPNNVVCVLCGKTNSSYFFPFPKEETIRLKWARFCNIKQNSLKDTHLLCERHFKKEDFGIQLNVSAVPCVKRVNEVNPSPNPVLQFLSETSILEQQRNAPARNVPIQALIVQKIPQQIQSTTNEKKENKKNDSIENIIIQDNEDKLDRHVIVVTERGKTKTTKEISLSKISKYKCYLCANTNSACYFKFPTIKTVFDEWLEFCKIPAKEFKSEYRLCENHFREKDFISNETGQSGKKLLPTAVPTKNRINIDNIVDLASCNNLIEEVLMDGDEEFSDISFSDVESSEENSDVRKLPENSKNKQLSQSMSKKRGIRYLGDMHDKDVEYPATVKKFINIAKNTTEKKNKRIRMLQAKNRRMVKKLENLELIISHLVELQNADEES